MGEVYLAEDTKLNRKVALKFMPTHLAGNADMRTRFTREAQAAAKLDHPNIVPVYEVGEFQGRPYFAMAHIGGKSLREVIKEGNLSTDEAINLTMQILEGLQDAHEAGIVHRDIKPGNIIIDNKGRPRLVDFGLAMLSGEDKLTKTGSTLGTVGYMSPEQVEGKTCDHRSDLFSVGVILYEMLTGRRPFEGDNDAAIVKAITDSTPEPVARYKSGTTGEIQQIVDKALSKDPSIRYQTAVGMLADLKRLSIGATKPIISRTRLWVSLAILAVVVITAFFFIDRYRISTKPKDDGWTNSIAVLVFRNLSADPEQEYFCEGMTDDIISRLSSIKQLKVTSLTSVIPFKSADRNLKDIGRELKVENILEGTIQKQGDSIRISAQLIRVKDDGHIWAERYYRECSSIFAVQDDISRSIVEAMKIALAGDEKDALAKRGTDNLEAYNAYMRGRHFWRKRIEKDLFKALDYFEQAVKLDSNYALAYVGISDVWKVLPDYSNYSRTEVGPKALEAVTKALELDNSLAEAHATRGLIYIRDLELDKAEKEFQQALALNPNYPWTYVWYAGIFTDYKDEYETGIGYLEKALELDPLSSVALLNLGTVKRNLGQYEEALLVNRKAMEIEPNNITFMIGYAYSLSWVNQNDSALYYIKKTIELEPDNWRSHDSYGQILGVTLGEREKAVEQFKISCNLSPNNPLPLLQFANYYYKIGDYKSAIPLLTKATDLNHRLYQAFNTLSYCYAGTGEYEKAIDAVNKAIDIAPFQPYYIDTRADIHATFGKFESAINDYRLFLEKSPNSVFEDTILIDMARAATFGRDSTLADSIYNVLLAKADSASKPAVRQLLMRPLRYHGKFRQAMNMHEEWMKTDGVRLGDDWLTIYTIYDMGLFNMYYLNELDSAIAQFTRMKDMIWRIDSTNHWNVIARGRVAQAQAMTGDEIAARSTLKNCWQTMDTTNRSRVNTFIFYKALTEYALGNYDSALALIKQRELNNFTVKIISGYIHLAAGKIDRAVEILEDAMSIYEDSRLSTYPERSVMGHYYLGMAYEAAGRTKDAIEQYETFLDIWKNADEGIKSVVDARRRLVKLKEII